MALLRTRNRGRARAARALARADARERARRAAPRPPIVELRGRDASSIPAATSASSASRCTVERGEFVFLVGPTGCGKSTLIKLLIREVEPAEGERADRRPRHRRAARRHASPFLRRRIGTVFQDFKLLPNRTVYDNVAYALQVIGGSRSEIRAKVPEILRLVGLVDKIHNYPDELSGGEQQRVSIARAFVNHPPLLLADEPTGNLDPETSIGIMQLLYRINRTGTTVLVVTHDREMVDKMRRRVIAPRRGPRRPRPGRRHVHRRRVDDQEFARPHARRDGRRRRGPHQRRERPLRLSDGPVLSSSSRRPCARCAAAPPRASPRSSRSSSPCCCSAS